MNKPTTTNAMRMLNNAHIPFESYEYTVKEFHNASETIDALNLDSNLVFKTLVLYPDYKNNNHDYYVFVVRALDTLDLKKCAKLANEKSLDLINDKDLLKITGYLRGGCSPIGMKKEYPIYFDQDILENKRCYVSAGKVGVQLSLSPIDLVKFCNGIVGDIK